MHKQTILITGTEEIRSIYIQFFLKKNWREIFSSRNLKKKIKIKKQLNIQNNKSIGYIVNFLVKNSLSNFTKVLKKHKEL
jgi:hypothetical protein